MHDAQHPSVLVVEHGADAGPGLLAEWLEEAGVELRICRPYAGEAVPGRCETDGLVVLGGAMGAADDDEAPWLPATRALLADAAVSGTPTLGICLGAQLLALALGGAVERGAAGPEVGVSEIELDPEAASDRLFAGFASPLPAAQWHLDAITSLPPGAVLLARGDRYPMQAFRLGEQCWGVQFHPEVDSRIVKEWADGETSPDVTAAMTERAVADVGRRERELADVWSTMGARFGEVVGESAAAGSGRDGGRA